MNSQSWHLLSLEAIVGRACHLSLERSDATVSDSFVAMEFTQMLGEIDAVKLVKVAL